MTYEWDPKLLRIALRQSGLTDYGLAKKLATNVDHVKKWCDGTVIPSVPTLSKICNALGVSPNIFFKKIKKARKQA